MLCYKREVSGEPLHIDAKKLGGFEAVGHRITGDRAKSSPNAGWDFDFVAMDDHSRFAFTQIQLDETGRRGAALLREATAYFDSLGVPIQRVLTDNGSACDPWESRTWSGRPSNCL